MCSLESDKDHTPLQFSPVEREEPHPDKEASVKIENSDLGNWIGTREREEIEAFNHQIRSCLASELREKTVSQSLEDLKAERMFNWNFL